MERSLRMLVAASLAALVSAHGAASAQPHPRLGLYGSIMGDGTPYILPGGSLDATVLDEVARYDEVILDVNPITPYRPDVASALRQRNPDIRLLAYVLGHQIWFPNDPDSLNHYPTRYRRLVRDLGGFLLDTRGGEYVHANVNLAKRGAGGRLVVAEGLADLFAEYWQRGGWDGVFIDVFCYSILWTQDAGNQIDFARAGYANATDFDNSWKAGTDTLCSRLRRITRPGAILVGNCANSAHHVSLNGWMRENFPFQNGGTWFDNVTAVPGYFSDDRNFVQPPHNYLFSAVSGVAAPYTSTNARKVRFGLGTAALGEGYGVFGPSDRNARTAPYQSWWYDEYAVDRATGRSSNAIAHTGWLGAARGPAYQMVWAGAGADAVTNSDFETNVTAGWNFWVNAPAQATLSRDATTAGRGAASARIDVVGADPVSWRVDLSSVGQLSLVAGASYSATFWAKASPARRITVVASRAGGGQWASRMVDVGPEWRQYQVPLQAGGSGLSSLQFHLAEVGGTVWLDDVHFQAGASNIWRRDFEHGVVLVNPSDQPQQVPLASALKRILGTVAPTVNDGLTSSQVTVQPSDAIFLLLVDTTPPAAITDIRQSP